MLLSLKLKNSIKKLSGNSDNLEFALKNIIVNGEKRGCSGFIKNKNNNVIIYVNTEKSIYLKTLLWRYALDMKDYRGCRNHHYDGKEEDFAKIIVTALNETNKFEAEKRTHL